MVSNQAERFEVAVLNLNGQAVLIAFGEGLVELDISTLPEGMYLIRTLQNGAVTYTKWMKI